MEKNRSDDAFSSSDRRALYEYRIAVDCIIPCLTRWGVKLREKHVLDLGCGSGGLVVGLAENGAKCLGLDHNESHIEQARRMASEHGINATFECINVLVGDELQEALGGSRFDLIILSEFVEHLVNRDNVKHVLQCLETYLAPEGHIYVSFPPWFNPFAGHQAGWPVIRFIPWFHIIPDFLKIVITPTHAERYLQFARELNRLTIGSFEHIVKRVPLRIVKKELFHLRPEFKIRYGVPTVRSFLFGRIPLMREVTSTGAFYLLGQLPMK